MVGNFFNTASRKKNCDSGRGPNESGGYVPTGTGERKQGEFGVGLRIKKGLLVVGSQKNLTFFWCKFPEIGVIRCKYGQI